MALEPHNRRALLATLCLVAVFLLYAPIGEAAWALYLSACCTKGECPIHGHHHLRTPTGPEHAMDCGHDVTAMTRCGMSCCHNPDRPAVTPVIFLLPAPIAASAATNFEVLVPAPGPMHSFHSREPLSPPPRTSAVAA